MAQSLTEILRYNFLKICFTQDERDGKNYDLPYQNSVRKKEDDLEHWFIYIFYELYFF